MADNNATDAVSRRNVLTTAGGLLAGSTMLAGLGAGRGVAETEESIQIEVQEMTEEYIAVAVWLPDGAEFSADDPFFGLADEFVVHDDAASLPEDTEGLANPVEMDFENPHDVMMYFRTRDVDWPEEHEEVTLGLGIFTERTSRATGGTPVLDTGTIEPVYSHAIGETPNPRQRRGSDASRPTKRVLTSGDF